MSGIIERIRIYPEKGSVGVERLEAHFIEGFGLEGDFHAKGGDRQLSLLLEQKEHEPKVRGSTVRGLCFSRFKENIYIRGMVADVLRPGVRLEAGGAVLEITGESKRCHEECTLYRAGKACPLAGQSLFAKVLKSGLIRAGDRIDVIV